MSKLKVSFDYDGTLADDFDGSINKQKDLIRSLARKYIMEGHDVCIITKRYDFDNRGLGKKNEYFDVFTLAKDLLIKKIYYTNREMKFSTIIKLKIDMHFENSEYEVKLINQACNEHNHKCICVHIEDKYWRDLIQ